MVIVSVVILDEYRLLTCLMILTIISSNDTFQFNDLINDNSSNIAVSYLMTNIISLSQINIVTQALYAVFGLKLDDDGSDDTSSGVLIIFEIENIIHAQMELVVDCLVWLEEQLIMQLTKCLY